MTHIANALQELKAAHDLGEDPPYDTVDAALWRVRFTLRAFYDAPAEAAEPETDVDDTPLKDLVTDLVHYAMRIDVNLDDVMDRAVETALSEIKEWAARA